MKKQSDSGSNGLVKNDSRLVELGMALMASLMAFFSLSSPSPEMHTLKQWGLLPKYAADAWRRLKVISSGLRKILYAMLE